MLHCYLLNVKVIVIICIGIRASRQTRLLQLHQERKNARAMFAAASNKITKIPSRPMSLAEWKVCCDRFFSVFILLKNECKKICVVQKCGPGSANRTSKRTLRSQIRPSQIPGAGNGLWLEEEASPGQVVGRYSGEEITEEEALRRVQVNLPSQKPSHPPPLILTVCMCVGWCRRIYHEDKQRPIP